MCDTKCSMKLLLTHRGNDAGNLGTKTGVFPPRRRVEGQTRRVSNNLSMKKEKRRNVIIGEKMEEGRQRYLLLLLILNGLSITDNDESYCMKCLGLVAQLAMRVVAHLQVGDHHPQTAAV